MLIRNSLAFALCICFFCIKFTVSSVQGLNRVNGNDSESCFIEILEREGIWENKYKCEMPCSKNTVDDLPRNGVKDIVCCPLTRNSSISASKCREYQESACNITFVGDDARKLKVSTCATIGQGAIIGGEAAKPRQFPHMALLGWANGTDRVYGCGGSLISEQFVLSAAHCFNHSVYGPIVSVRLGVHNRSDANETSQIDLNVADLTQHPDYDINYEYDDIGLIKLERKVRFNHAIRPACLPQQSIAYNTAAIATGWGLVSKGAQSTVLMKVSLDIFDYNKCKSSFPIVYYRPQWILEESQFCAGSPTHNNNTCGGDSGGPLQVIRKGHYCTYTIIGVTSHGKDCERFRTNSIGVYANVFHYLDWIESIVWPDQNSKSD